MPSNVNPPLRTPDGRYMVVRGHLWRLSNPGIPAEQRATLVQELMDARRALRKSNVNPASRAQARGRVDAAKTALGERGPVWWDDGAPDYNRHSVSNTPYAAWYERVRQGSITD